MLVLGKRSDERLQDVAQVRDELVTCFFFERGKGTAACFLDAFVVVEDHGQQTLQHGLEEGAPVGNEILGRSIDDPASVTTERPTGDRADKRL